MNSHIALLNLQRDCLAESYHGVAGIVAFATIETQVEVRTNVALDTHANNRSLFADPALGMFVFLVLEQFLEGVQVQALIVHLLTEKDAGFAEPDDHMVVFVAIVALALFKAIAAKIAGVTLETLVSVLFDLLFAVRAREDEVGLVLVENVLKKKMH